MERRTPLKRSALKSGKPLKRTPMKRPLTPEKLAAQRANGAKRGPYTRAGETRCCEREGCENEFYAFPREIGKRRFCSRACAALVKRVERTCSICGGTFTSPGKPRKTCSPKCLAEAKRRAKLGNKNPAYGTGRTSSEGWRSAKEDRCRCCGSRRRLTQHHVVYEQHVRKHGGDPWDPADSLTVCFDCHMGHHHSADRRIKVSQFRPENIEFAFAVLGAYTPDYFTRYYDNDLADVLMKRAVAMAA